MGFPGGCRITPTLHLGLTEEVNATAISKMVPHLEKNKESTSEFDSEDPNVHKDTGSVTFTLRLGDPEEPETICVYRRYVVEVSSESRLLNVGKSQCESYEVHFPRAEVYELSDDDGDYVAADDYYDFEDDDFDPEDVDYDDLF